jgi:hypothetical protein
VQEQIEHFEIHPENYVFYVQFQHVLVVYLDKVIIIVNGKRLHLYLFVNKTFSFQKCRHKVQVKEPESTQLEITNGSINDETGTKIKTCFIKLNNW